jgi:hypothetical protein
MQGMESREAKYRQVSLSSSSLLSVSHWIRKLNKRNPLRTSEPRSRESKKMPKMRWSGRSLARRPSRARDHRNRTMGVAGNKKSICCHRSRTDRPITRKILYLFFIHHRHALTRPQVAAAYQHRSSHRLLPSPLHILFLFAILTDFLRFLCFLYLLAFPRTEILYIDT